MSVEADGATPFLRRFAYSQGDANNQAEYLRLLLDRSRAVTRKSREKQPLVLIVEDDAENLLAYEETLRIEGYRIASATTIAEAGRLLRQTRPSAILLDHVLPDGDGTRFSAALRDVEPDLPIVMVTGCNRNDLTFERGRGPDALLGKPCRPETLTAVFKLLLQRVKDKSAAKPKPMRLPAGRVTTARCPLCGTSGALVAGERQFHCQSCGKEGALDPRHLVDVNS